MKCPACLVDNEEHAETCFTCGQSLLAVLRRGNVVASRYEILNALGKGGMGMVYKAHDRVLEEEIAIKVLRSDVARSPEMGRRFRSEIRLARKVSHRNVCRIHEYGEDQGVRYISMELIEGVDLKQVIRDQKGGLPPQEAFEVSIQVAKGLQAIHDVGIVHRDLKAANLMRDRRGIVKLMDFGIAKEENAAATSATAAGDIVGTPEYMSPEQARGHKVDARSDIYALAVVIHEIFSGDVPFRGDSPIVTIFKHIQDHAVLEGPGAPPFPAALVPVLKRGLAKDPGDRFDSADQLVDALRAARKATFPDTPSQPPAFSTVGLAADAPPAPVTPAPKPAPPPRASVAARAAAQTAVTPAPVPMASPPTPAPATPTPQPSPAYEAAAAHADAPPTEALASLPTEEQSLPPTLPHAASKEAARVEPAPAPPPPAPPPRAPVTPPEDARAARQQTQRLPGPVVAAATAPARADAGARRLVAPALVIVALLAIMVFGVLLVGRLIRSLREETSGASASPVPPGTAAPPTATPRPQIPVEEVVTVPVLPTPAAVADAPLAGPTPGPVTPSAPTPIQALTPAPPAPNPRPATPRPTSTPPPRPAEPTGEQVRSQQVATALREADAALSGQRYDEAGRHYDEALKLDAGDARAAAGKARAQWAATAIRRVFALGRTVNVPIKGAKGPAGFDTDEVEVKSQDFLCEMGIEVQPPAVKPGGDYGYSASVSMTSVGRKSIKLKSLQVNVTLDGTPSSESLPPLVKEVQKQRVTVAEVKGAWKEEMKSWRLEVVVTGDKGDTCRNTISWR